MKDGLMMFCGYLLAAVVAVTALVAVAELSAGTFPSQIESET